MGFPWFSHIFLGFHDLSAWAMYRLAAAKQPPGWRSWSRTAVSNWVEESHPVAQDSAVAIGVVLSFFFQTSFGKDYLKCLLCLLLTCVPLVVFIFWIGLCYSVCLMSHDVAVWWPFWSEGFWREIGVILGRHQIFWNVWLRRFFFKMRTFSMRVGSPKSVQTVCVKKGWCLGRWKVTSFKRHQCVCVFLLGMHCGRLCHSMLKLCQSSEYKFLAGVFGRNSLGWAFNPYWALCDFRKRERSIFNWPC